MARLTALYATLVFCLLHLVTSVIIPGPDPGSHNYSVAVSSFPLCDASCQSGKTVGDNPINRRIMLSVFLPIERNTTCTQECEVPYMPRKTAETLNSKFFGDSDAGVFDSLSYTHCCRAAKPIDIGSYPLVFIEPQAGASRLMYTTLAKFVSANGAVVVMIDRPGDALIVEYGDGFAWANPANPKSLSPFDDIPSWNETIGEMVAYRSADVAFVTEALSDQSLLQQHFANFTIKSPIDNSTYSIIGHGLGGATATMLGLSNRRIRFSINMSGTAPLLLSPSNATTYFFGRSDFRREHDAHWNASWPQFTGKVTEWDLKDSAIFDFSDLPWIVDLAKQQKQGSVVGEGLGSLGPNAYHATACFVEAYVRMELLDKPKWLTDCARLFPQMVPYTAFDPDE